MKFSSALLTVRGVVSLSPVKQQDMLTDKGQQRPWLSSTVQLSMPGEREKR